MTSFDVEKSAAGPVADFAARLRQMKKEARLTYRELGERAKYSHAHMIRADRGDELPSWAVAKAYLNGCGVRSPRTLAVFQALWERAAKSSGLQASAAKEARRTATRTMRSIRTNDAFGEQLRVLAQRGSPARKRGKAKTLREIAADTGFSKSTLADWFAGNRLPSKMKLEKLAVLIGATQAESAELEAVRERLAWNARADDSELHMLSVLDELSPEDDQQLVQQLAAVLLQSSEQRDRAAAVRTVGAEAAFRSYSGPEDSKARHRARLSPDQLGHEQAELEALAQRVAELVIQQNAQRGQDPATLARWIIPNDPAARPARRAW